MNDDLKSKRTVGAARAQILECAGLTALWLRGGLTPRLWTAKA